LLKTQADLLGELNRAFNVPGAAVSVYSTMCRRTLDTRHSYIIRSQLAHTQWHADTIRLSDAVNTNITSRGKRGNTLIDQLFTPHLILPEREWLLRINCIYAKERKTYRWCGRQSVSLYQKLAPNQIKFLVRIINLHELASNSWRIAYIKINDDDDDDDDVSGTVAPDSWACVTAINHSYGLKESGFNSRREMTMNPYNEVGLQKKNDRADLIVSIMFRPFVHCSRYKVR